MLDILFQLLTSGRRRQGILIPFEECPFQPWVRTILSSRTAASNERGGTLKWARGLNDCEYARQGERWDRGFRHFLVAGLKKGWTGGIHHH